MSSLELGLGVEPEHDFAAPLHLVLDLELPQTLNLHTHTHTHGNNDYIIVCTTETELVSQRSRRSENVSYFHSLTTLNFRETSELEKGQIYNSVVNQQWT